MIVFISCQEQFFNLENPTDVQNSFTVFWTEFDRHYAYFELKNINWDSVYAVNIDQLNSEEDLAVAFDNIVQFLEDGHVNVFMPNQILGYRGWKEKNPVNLTVNYLKYLKNATSDGYLTYGFIRNENIGYINIPTFSDDVENYEGIDRILNELTETRGIIVDVRSNGGGSDYNALRIASRFTDQERMYRKVRYRNGPGHSDFTKWIEASINPEGDFQYLKPVMVLTNRGCFSSAEGFILKMKVMPHVALVGDTTAGGSGNPVFKDLPNGWVVRLSNWQVVTPDEKFYEGIGIPPDYPVQFTKSDSIKGNDVMIEKAIKLIKSKT